MGLEFWVLWFFLGCDRCLKEEVGMAELGMAELGMAEVGHGSLKSGVAGFCWSLEIIGV